MILVLGGTSDSLEICDELNRCENLDYILSVTTEYGRDIAKKHAKNISMAKLNEIEMIDFIKANNITSIIDATHPYAVEVSRTAIKCANTMYIDYIRYERTSLIEDIDYEKKVIVSSVEDACCIANDIGNNIFIGTGSKNLDKYVNNIHNKNLIARVLPTSEVLISCENLGLNGDNIIAMKGPFSQRMNEETYKQYNIDLVITKESGVAGGFLEKVYACQKLDIPVVIIKREEIEYPRVINDIEYLVSEI